MSRGRGAHRRDQAQMEQSLSERPVLLFLGHFWRIQDPFPLRTSVRALNLWPPSVALLKEVHWALLLNHQVCIEVGLRLVE